MGNAVEIRGRGLASGWPLQAKLPYLAARVTSPDAAPMDPFDPARCRYDVQAARVEVSDQGACQLVADALARGPGALKAAKVAFKPGNVVAVSGWVACRGVTLPVAATYGLERVDARAVRLVPRSFCGLPAAWVQRLPGLDLAADVALPAGLVARVGHDGAVTIDQRGSRVNAPLDRLETGAGTLVATVGRAPQAGPAGQMTLRVAGELASDGGILHDARVTCTANPGEPALPVYGWEHHGKARLEAGAVALDPAALKALIQRADPLFKVEDVGLDGTTYTVSGTYNCFIKVPTALELRFTLTPDGQLRLATGARVLGLRLRGLDGRDDLAKLPFLKADRDGWVVDLDAVASLAMPRIGSLRASGGRLELRN